MKTKQAHGFTLIELLVTIAVISVLAGMLLPALAKSKHKARSIICMNNHQQLMRSLCIYLTDYQDQYPGAEPWAPSGASTPLPGWVGTNLLTLDIPEFPGNWDTDTFLQESVLARYVGNSLGVFKCPSDQSTAINNKGERVSRLRSMAMATWVGGPGIALKREGAPVADLWQVFLSPSDLNDPGPANTIAFLDERSDSINDGEFAVTMYGYPDKPEDLFMINWPSTYHMNAGTFSFADGHAEIKRWRDPRTIMPVMTKDIGGFARAGTQASPHNEDIIWMQERSTRKVQ